MTTNRFRSVALALRDYVGNTYDLLAAADAVVALDSDIQPERPTITSPDGKATWNWKNKVWDFDHDFLVSRVTDNALAMDFMRRKKKIDAIKEVRRDTKCGLKAAKDAVEDSRVTDAANVDPWNFVDSDEPPF